MKKSISIKQLARILKEGTAPVDPAAAAPEAPVDPAAAAPAAPAAVDPAIVDLVTQLATACGLTVTPAAPAEAPADPAAAQAVAERRARLRRLREARIARRRRALRK